MRYSVSVVLTKTLKVIAFQMNVHTEFRCFGEIRPAGYSDDVVKSDIDLMSYEIESQFGPAVGDWTLRFVCFLDTAECPHVYYPDGFKQTIGIRLAGPALRDIDFARFQLAHELVHCLAPSGGEKAFVIEEGAAAKYQHSYSKKYLNCGVKLRDGKYKEALRLYNELSKQYSGAIKALRQIEPYFCNWSHDTFIVAGIHLEKSLERLLLTKFKDFQC